MQVSREFNHRSFGNVGKVVLESDVTTIKLNGKPIPADSVEYLLNFALQSLQDAYAGSANADEAKASFGKKLDAIVGGTLGARSGAAAVDELTKVQRQIVRAILKTQFGAKSEAWQEFADKSESDQNSFLDEKFAKNSAKLADAVAERMAELKAERDRKAKLAKTVAIEL